jgi:hypothetical protein
MALDFPPNPVDGQLYPNPPIPGAQQYQWSSTKGTWLTVFQGINSIGAAEPVFLSGPPSDPTINVRPATDTQSGYISALDKQKLNSIPAEVGTVTEVVAGTGLGAPDSTGQSITTSGTLNLLPANFTRLGGVKPGQGLNVDTAGVMNIQPPSSLTLGGVKAGQGVQITNDGTISVAPGSGYVVLDNLSPRFNGVTTVFTLTINTVPYSPINITSLLLFVGGIVQVPNASFTLSGSTITFTEAPPTNSNFYGIAFT